MLIWSKLCQFTYIELNLNQNNYLFRNKRNLFQIYLNSNTPPPSHCLVPPLPANYQHPNPPPINY